MCHCNILIVDYRGYGRSEGKPTEDGLRLDAQACYQHLYQRFGIDQDKIFFFGRGLGGAVATGLVEDRNGGGESIKGLILENTWTSFSDMIDDVAPVLSSFKRIIQRFEFNTLDRIDKVNIPILFIRGMRDHLVPPGHSKVLWDYASNAKRKYLYDCKEGGHDTSWLTEEEEYVDVLNAFFKECETGEASSILERLTRQHAVPVDPKVIEEAREEEARRELEIEDSGVAAVEMSDYEADMDK